MLSLIDSLFKLLIQLLSIPLRMDNFDFIAFDQMSQLRADISSGNMEGFNATLSKLRGSLDNETFQAKLTPLLREAVETNSFQVVHFFLENHVPMNSQFVLRATMNTSYQTLEVFLNHGWDINTPLDWVTPPALAYVDLILIIDFC